MSGQHAGVPGAAEALRAVTLADMAAPPLRWQPRVHVERLVVEA